MSIIDPANLMQRVPELHALTDDPKISKAIASGDAFRVYRALVLARLLRRLPEHAALLEMLTSERRLFAKTEKSHVSLANFQSIGFNFVGKSEQESDDSFIALHAFVIFNSIPLVPLGAYVVKNGGGRQWRVFARVPLSVGAWLYSRSLAWIAVISILVGSAFLDRQFNTQQVLIVNGFDVPITVEFDHQAVNIAARNHRNLAVKVGKIQALAKAENGITIDQLNQTIVRSDRLSVWNIAGVAPLIMNTRVFGKDAGVEGNSHPSEVTYCGQHFFELAHVRYVFEEWPATLSQDYAGQDVTLSQLTLPAGTAESSAMACVEYAFAHGIEKQIAKGVELIAELNNWSDSFLRPTVAAAKSVSTQEAKRVAQRIIQAKPDNLDVERIVQQIREDAGDREELLSEYAERVQDNPASATEQYLYASLFYGEQGLNKMQELAVRFPQDVAILRSLAWRKGVHGDYNGAVADIAKLRKLAPLQAASLLDVEVRALVAQRKPFDAMNRLNTAIRDKTASDRAGHAAELGVIASHSGTDAELYLRALPGDEANQLRLDFYRVRAGLKPLSVVSENHPAVQLAIAVRQSPDKALSLVKSVERIWLNDLGLDQVSLLYGEAVRVNDQQAQHILLPLMHLARWQQQRLREFVIGADVSLDDLDLHVDVQAASYFIRSRNAALPAAERAALRARAARTDYLRGVISVALNQW